MARLRLTRPGEDQFAQNHPALDVARRARKIRIERIVETGLAALAVERAERPGFWAAA